MKSRDRALLAFGLGVVLMLNPLYAFPNGNPRQQTVTYEAERVDYLPTQVREASNVDILECSGDIDGRLCVQALSVGRNGTMRVRTDVGAELDPNDASPFTVYDYVHFPGGYAEPNATLDAGTLVLSYDPVTERQIMRLYAEEYRVLESFAQRVVDHGSASRTVRFTSPDPPDPPLDVDDQFVVRNGTFYLLEIAEETPVSHVIPPLAFDVLRVGGFLAGLVLVFWGRGAHARRRDAARERGDLNRPFE